MGSQKENYKTWARDNIVWTKWAKPVLFMDNYRGYAILKDADVSWIRETTAKTMVIIDLPGKKAIEEGLALTKEGYWPVPLYNGVDGKMLPMLVDVAEIVKCLNTGTKRLKGISATKDAKPAFLLDYNRMNNSILREGKYDNRWCVFAQDMPSADFILSQGIRRIVVRTDGRIAEDLSHILYAYQEKNIRIHRCDGITPWKNVRISKPARWRCSFQRFKVMLGLRRNAAGGFGGLIPDPSDSSYSGG